MTATHATVDRSCLCGKPHCVDCGEVWPCRRAHGVARIPDDRTLRVVLLELFEQRENEPAEEDCE